MSHKKSHKKKRFGRRIRKLVKAGKIVPPKVKILEAPKEKPIISLAKEETPYDQKKKIGFLGFLEEKFARENKSAVVRPEDTILNTKKSREIMGHLRVVLTTSALCLTILGSLYYLEQKNGWVNKFNSEIKNSMSGWDWKL